MGGGNPAIENRRTIGCAAELIAGSIRTLAPRVICKLMKKLQGGSIGLEAIGALRETLPLAAHGPIEGRVTNAAVEPVINAVVEIAGLGMSIADPPAGDDVPPHIDLVVAVGVFQKKKPGRLSDNDAAIGEGEAGRDI